MAAFNVEDAARQGRGETIPPGWTKFPASHGVILANLLVYIIGAVVVFGLAAYIVITGTLPGGANGDQGLAPYEFVALLIFGCIFLFIGLRMIPGLFKSDDYFFLLTNQGFVYAAGKKLMGLPFAEISSAYRQSGWLGGKLIVRRQAGASLVVPLGRFYTTQAVREMEKALVASLKPAGKKKRGKPA
ncbi:MAG TPA: hypothetical protein VFU69_08340 [Ktedonobacterales bacterium]|nr:hypothetical protein [Ktedonobacterales bacterium]